MGYWYQILDKKTRNKGAKWWIFTNLTQDQCINHTETSQLTLNINQMIGFYMIQNSVKLNKVLSPHHMLNSLLLWWFQLLIIQEIRLFPTFRSSHWRCSVKKGVLRNFAKFTEKHLCESLFLNKVAGVRLATLLKKRLWYRCFPMNFAKF